MKLIVLVNWIFYSEKHLHYPLILYLKKIISLLKKFARLAVTDKPFVIILNNNLRYKLVIQILLRQKPVLRQLLIFAVVIWRTVDKARHWFLLFISLFLAIIKIARSSILAELQM